MERENLKALAKAVMTQWVKDGQPDDFDNRDMYECLLGIDDAKNTLPAMGEGSSHLRSNETDGIN